MAFKIVGRVGFAIFGVLVLAATGSAQEAVFIVRHTDPPPILSFDEILDDTPLSESGQERAKMLAERLKDAGISAIYATETVRTQQTAAPLAGARGLQVAIHPFEDTDGLVALLRSKHQGERVLVVGHWSTIPLIVKAFGFPQEVRIERSAYDNLFVVTPQDDQVPTVLHLHY